MKKLCYNLLKLALISLNRETTSALIYFCSLVCLMTALQNLNLILILSSLADTIDKFTKILKTQKLTSEGLSQLESSTLTSLSLQNLSRSESGPSIRSDPLIRPSLGLFQYNKLFSEHMQGPQTGCGTHIS